MQQRPGEQIGVECIGTGRGHQLAELAHAAFL